MTFEEWKSGRTSDVNHDAIFEIGEAHLCGDFAAAEAVEVFIYDDAAVFKLRDGTYYNTADDGLSLTLEAAECAAFAGLERERARRSQPKAKTTDAYTVGKYTTEGGGVTVTLRFNGHGGVLLRHFSGNQGATKAEAYAATLQRVADVLNGASEE
jgi:hypothetical protein